MAMVAGGVLFGVLLFVAVRPDQGSAAEGVPPVAAPTSSTSESSATSTTSTTSASTTTTTTTATTIPRGDLVIHGVGDVNFDPDYITVFAESGYQIAFDGLDGIFLEDDLTIINLECPPTDAGAQLDKEFSFRCDPASLPIARDNGVDVASLANNHGQDRGTEGMLDSIANLRAAGIEPVGVGANIAEATTPAIIEINGWTVAVLGMGGVLPSDSWLATDERAGMASGDDIDQMVAAVEAAAGSADVVVVTIHWGVEGVAEPDPEDRARAEAMIAAGADVIFGHHPHRLGELEFIDGVPVYWTLGNFVWPRLSDAGATTAVARVVIDPDGGVEACLIPAFIETSGRPELRGDPLCEGER
jgi:poly-gamma-glutamate capsule biosynthesis protein CapA/YwtB (metallophosphatase superfamily)